MARLLTAVLIAPLGGFVSGADTESHWDLKKNLEAFKDDHGVSDLTKLLKDDQSRQGYEAQGEGWVFPETSSSNEHEVIPRTVHFMLTDPGTRFFDWTCYMSVKAAQIHARPTTIYFHVLKDPESGWDAEPTHGWWEAAKKMGVMVPFSKKDVPMELNGVKVSKSAHIADFRRFQVLIERGGIYMDTDHVLIRPIDELLHYTSVWGRQGA
jgi:hypothetical protein